MVPPAKDAGQEEVNATTSEIVESKRPFSDNELRNVDSLDALKALIGPDVGNAQDLGSGFALLDADAKQRLIGVPLIFVFWTFNESEVGEAGEFVSAHIVQLQGNNIVGKWIVNDGSTGIYRQLRDYTDDKGVQQGLVAAKGLRRSDYDYVDSDGKKKPATTYYIDTSAVA